MDFPFSNHEEGDAWLPQGGLREEGVKEVSMEEDEGNSLGVHPPASERVTLAGISTRPSSPQAMRSSTNPESPEVHEGLPPRRPLHRLHGNNFHNLIHNYGFENTPRVHLPSNWDIPRPRESDAGTNTWGPENKHIMAEVEKNTELLHKALHEIQGLKEALMDIFGNYFTTTTSIFITKRKLSIGYGHSPWLLASLGEVPRYRITPLSFAFTYLSSIHSYLLP